MSTDPRIIVAAMISAGVVMFVFMWLNMWLNNRANERRKAPPEIEVGGRILDRFMLAIDADLRALQYESKDPEESRRIFALRDKIQLEYAQIKGEVPRS